MKATETAFPVEGKKKPQENQSLSGEGMESPLLDLVSRRLLHGAK